MIDLSTLTTDLAWPITILVAWLAGEYGHHYIKLPRISIYAIVGFILAPSQTGFLPSTQNMTMLLANIAFGLILFECGYRINLHWLKNNPWIFISSLTEATLTFAAIYYLVTWFGLSTATALLLAALSMATSPATVIRIINEQRSSGQVTERILHLSVLNCVLAVFVFKIIVGLVAFQASGDIWEATYSSLIVALASVMLGIVAGIVVPGLLCFTKHTNHASTLAFIITIIFLVVLAYNLKLSPVLATLTFGVTARHRRIMLNSSQRGFGTLGDLLSVLLFTFITSALDWKQAVAGVILGLAIILVRQIAKIIGISLFAYVSGITWRKGLLIGMATTPISVFVIFVLEQSHYFGVNLFDQLAPLAVAALILDVLSPIFIQRALIWANEVPETKES